MATDTYAVAATVAPQPTTASYGRTMLVGDLRFRSCRSLRYPRLWCCHDPMAAHRRAMSSPLASRLRADGLDFTDDRRAEFTFTLLEVDWANDNVLTEIGGGHTGFPFETCRLTKGWLCLESG